MLLHYDLMQKLIQQNEEEIRNQSLIIREKQEQLPDGEVLAEEEMAMPNLITENSLIVTLINLGLATSDPKTMVNSATSIAHMTEILYCNPAVASKQARNFMMKMLKDSKNMKGHR